MSSRTLRPSVQPQLSEQATSLLAYMLRVTCNWRDPKVVRGRMNRDGSIR